MRGKLKNSIQEDHKKQKKRIPGTLVAENQLKSKRELIEKLIQENLPQIDKTDDFPNAFH